MLCGTDEDGVGLLVGRFERCSLLRCPLVMVPRPGLGTQYRKRVAKGWTHMQQRTSGRSTHKLCLSIRTNRQSPQRNLGLLIRQLVIIILVLAPAPSSHLIRPAQTTRQLSLSPQRALAGTGIARRVEVRVGQQRMWFRCRLGVGYRKRFFQVRDSLVQFLGLGKDQSTHRGSAAMRFRKRGTGTRIPNETHLRPLPPVIAPFGQICSTPRLTQEVHGHDLCSPNKQ